MQESFADMLSIGGKRNSLGRAGEVVDVVLADKSRLGELYDCVYHQDAWVRMRAVDSLEKVCRVHPDWIRPYVDRLLKDFSHSTQPSILWHQAQIYTQVQLSAEQQSTVIRWLKGLLSSEEIDWIVAANSMDALVYFTDKRSVERTEALNLLDKQRNHRSNAVKKRAAKLIAKLSQG